MASVRGADLRIPLSAPGRKLQLHPEIESAALRAIRSGHYVLGPELAAWENELATFLGVRHCIGLGSGTDALELAVKVADRGRGGPVVLAANAGGYASAACHRAGLPVRFADVSPATHCLSEATVAPALPGATVLVVTHLYGRMGPVWQLRSLCAEHGVSLVEDCAQSLGALQDGLQPVMAGSVGELACFSFYPTKNLGALGDGGAVVTSQDELARALVELRQYGWGEKYRVQRPGGVNSRLDEVQAAVLRAQLPFLQEDNSRRRAIVTAYRSAAPVGVLDVLPTQGPGHVAHLAVAVSPERDQVRDQLRRQGIATEVHYPIPDHRQPAFAHQHREVSLRVTEDLSNRVVTLPCFPELTDEEVDFVCRALSQL